MKIVWKENPLATAVELDEKDVVILRLRLRVEDLEERILGAHMELDPEHQVWARQHLKNVPADLEGFVARARAELRWPYVAGEESRSGETFEQRLDELVSHYVEELRGEHMGDCTCVPASCSKCYAEHLMGIDTIEGLGKHPGSKISGLFSRRPDGSFPSLDDVLERLRVYEPVNMSPETWPQADFDVHVPRWKEEARHAYEWLSAYKREKLGR